MAVPELHRGLTADLERRAAKSGDRGGEALTLGRASFVLHGSGNPGIAEFVPRQPLDLTDFGSRLAVFAATDGLWPMFYAILDRDSMPLSMCNG